MNKGAKYINNGTIQKVIHDSDELPNGFIFGKLPISEETKKILSDSHKGIKLSKEAIQKGKETFKKRYGVNSPSQLEGVSKKISYKLSSKEVRDKTKQTLLEKYGVESPLQYEEFKQKKINTSLQRYGVEYYSNKDKEYETKKLNGTLGLYETTPEKEIYKLLVSEYGKSNVFKQYRTNEYPFKADFYIKSLDCYIEYNGFFTHKDHLFDGGNLEDIKELDRLSMLKLNGNEWASNIIYTWTDLDVRKSKYKDKINLILFYPDKQDDIVLSFKKLKAELDSYIK